jgi:Nif-specific regulatory protein
MVLFAREGRPLVSLKQVKPDASDRERLSVILELSRGFAAETDFDELLPLVLRHTKEVLNAEGSSLLLLEEGGKELFFPVSSSAREGVDIRLHDLRFPVSEGIAGRVTRTRQALRVNDVAENPYFNPKIDQATGERTQSVVCAPLRSRGTVIGVIEVINSLDGGFTQGDLEFLEALAPSVALAVETARLVGSLRERTTRLAGEISGLRRERLHADSFPEIIGRSPAMQSLFALIESASDSTIAVQIQGETGVGKELVARAIHNHGARREAPLVALNCGAMPAALLESELFGFARGAFTGADREKPGLFEAADGGTLFLDEINAMPMDQQAKLLRVIQEGEFRRLGETASRKVDVRLISASNADLAEEVREKRFREDLYYRLNVFPIVVPPLRERPGDVSLIATAILARISERTRKNVKAIDSDVFEILDHYAWPGNVRELENELERAVALASVGTSIGRSCLSERVVELSEKEPEAGSQLLHQRGRLREARQQFERQFLASVLRLHSGNATKAAKELGISRQMLQKKIRDWNLRDPRSQ